MPRRKSTDRNLFRLSRFVLLKMPYFFRQLTYFRAPKKRILIIKADAIGDYILFRNFIELVKGSEKFKGYRIDLLGNKLWEEIAITYDREFIDNFIFVTLNELYMAPLQTLKLGWRLFLNNYDTVLQPTYTRTLAGDGVAALSGSGNITGFESDLEGINERYKVKTDGFYRQLLKTPEGAEFEFQRTRFFFENVLGEKLSIQKPILPVEKNIKNGVLVVPGAGDLKRTWAPENFVELIGRITGYASQTITLAGGADDIQTGQFLMRSLAADKVINLIGKTSLTQLIKLIAEAELVISNETSAVHIAAAVNTKAICILGGGHFGRFVPYPKNIQNSPVCLTEKMDCFNCNWRCIYNLPEHERYPCISAISIEAVWEGVRAALRADDNFATK